MSARAEVLDRAARDLNPALVTINSDVIRALNIPRGTLTPMSADVAPAARESLEAALRYLLMVNALNFRFWDLRDGEVVRYAYEGVVGAMGMRQAFAKAWGHSMSPTLFWIGLDSRGVSGLFAEIPAIADRESVLNELCNNETHVRSVLRAIAQAIQHTGVLDMNLARLIAETLPESYGDAYLKKAQLTLTEMASFASERGTPVSVGDFTLFADYQLPKVLRGLGVLTYSESLAAKVDGCMLIDAESCEERAIRAATIVAGEEVAEALGCTPAVLDNFLWSMRGSAGKAPFHLTSTRAY